MSRTLRWVCRAVAVAWEMVKTPEFGESTYVVLEVAVSTQITCGKLSEVGQRQITKS